MKKIRNFFDRLVDKQVSPIGLAVFRIAYATVFFFEVLFIYQYKELFFDPIPFLEPAQMEVGVPLLIWLGAVFCIIVGFQTRVATIVNYVFTLVFISTLTSFEYHIHYIYIGINFLLMFMPISKMFSIDERKAKGGKDSVSVLYYYLPIFVGIAMVYFDSIFFKLKSEMWLNGNGLWLPASIPNVSLLHHSQWLLDSKTFMKFLGYFTLAFEFVFIFFFWVKRLGIPFFIIGFLLHFSILFVFPIPLFALAVVAIYLLLVPNYIWERLFRKFENVSLVKKEQGNVFLRKSIVPFLIVIIIFQINSTLNFSPATSGFAKRAYQKLGLKKTVMSVANLMEDFSSKTLGIAPHGVFVDAHFAGYNHIFSVSYIDENGSEVLLPITEDGGGPGEYIEGSNWAYLSFRVDGPRIQMKKLRMGVIRFTAFWAEKNDVPLNDAMFNIRVKKFDTPPQFKWEEGFLERQRAKPWRQAGTLHWINNQPIFNVPDIESNF